MPPAPPHADAPLGQGVDDRGRIEGAHGSARMDLVDEAEAIRLTCRPCAIEMLPPFLQERRQDSSVACCIGPETANCEAT